MLIAAYLGVLELSRPHVSGDELRFDSFVKLVGDGRIVNAHILDEDAYVVGRYVPGATDETSPSTAAAVGRQDPHESRGLLSTTEDGVVADAVRGKTRAYNAPLLRGTQSDLLQLLLRNNVPITIDQQVGKRVASLASVLLPGLILVVLMTYLILSYRRGTGLFGIPSRARRITSDDGTFTFEDVAGQEAAVTELREIKEFLANPARFTDLGAEVPKGVLLYGPPGCGKTLLAKALAGEAGAAFYSISGSDFVELYVGVGAARVRELFQIARQNAPSIVFIDELDTVGRQRSTGGTMNGSHGEQEQALNQILAEMDGFSTSDGLVVVAATNRPDVLDPALLRPGRFDRSIGLERPDETARLAILTRHARSKRIDPGVDLAAVASRAMGLTGADLASVVNEAALLAARAERAAVGQVDLDEALQRILETPERQRRLSLRGRSVARRHTGSERVTFSEIGGVADAVAELSEVRDYLADPDRFGRIGARIPKGILLSGPPGCGKTLLARAVAGEANAAFLSVSGSEFIEVFVGEGASRVRELFADARAVAPAIVFIDEIDSVGGRREAAMEANRERDQTLNQILVELDGFEPRTGVIVIAATNRPDMLDPALVRRGRFDRHVAMSLPDRSGRLEILELHARDKRLGPDVALGVVATLTRGFSGADLAGALNEAALLAHRQGLQEIPMSLMEEGIERTIGGIAGRATILGNQERKVIAYHEAGHALVASGTPGAPLPRKLTIVPRGQLLGHCAVVEPTDRVLLSSSELVGHMAILLGGRAAEELVFGEGTSAAAADVERVAEIAHHMVCNFGMSEALGPIGYAKGGAGRSSSDEEARLIYAEVRRVVDQAHVQARGLLLASRPSLDRVASALLEQETLTSAEFVQLTAPPLAPRLASGRH